MKNTVLLICALLIPAASFAEGGPSPRVCYQLSADGRTWSRTPETLCIETLQNGKSLMTLESGLAGQATEITRFTLRRTAGVPGSFQYTVEDPVAENSLFNELSVRLNNALAVRFKGYQDPDTGAESGVLTIGHVTFHYRSLFETTFEAGE